jgi:hypothetical protein
MSLLKAIDGLTSARAGDELEPCARCEMTDDMEDRWFVVDDEKGWTSRRGYSGRGVGRGMRRQLGSGVHTLSIGGIRHAA